MKIITTNSFEETRELGASFANKVKNGGILALFGDLGSGKTTFVQGLATGLGITNNIISPTFLIIRTYSLELIQFYHIDLYRIQTDRDILELGIDEILSDPSHIVAIEWPEKMKHALPKTRIDIYFEYIDTDMRRIRVQERNQQTNT